MAGHSTKPYKNTFSGSVGAGMGSLFNPGGRKYYILEHKVSSKYHRAGESQEIIVDNIEIGRDPHCQVRFDESFKTVSRHHAGIVKDGDMWKLVQISKTNSTFLNGRPIKTEWYLQNGDEIQLSVNGPKLGFIIPTGNKSTVGSIGLTRRLSLFRQQALRPYKTAIAVLSCVLVLAVGGLVTWNFTLNNQLEDQNKQLAEQLKIINNQDLEIEENNRLIDSINNEIIAVNDKLNKSRKQLSTLNKKYENLKIKIAESTPEAGAIASTFKDTYYIECYACTEKGEYIIDENRNRIGWCGTGFLLNNGYLVTAQHMIHIDDVVLKEVQDPNDKTKTIKFIDPSNIYNYLNAYYYMGGVKIVMAGISNTNSFKVEYTFNNNPFKLGQCKRSASTFKDEKGNLLTVQWHEYTGGDWAYLKLDKAGSLSYDADFSMHLPIQTKLTVVGFPANQGERIGGNISPIVTEAITSREGLEDNGTIKTSNNNTDHGNSGGPVYAVKDGKFVVVGIHSGVTYGDDPSKGSVVSKGRVVPIGAIFK